MCQETRRRYRPRSDIASFTEMVRKLPPDGIRALILDLQGTKQSLYTEFSEARRKYNRAGRMLRIAKRALFEEEHGYVGEKSRTDGDRILYRLPAYIFGDVSPVLTCPVIHNSRGTPAAAYVLEMRWPKGKSHPVSDILGDRVYCPTVKDVHTADLHSAVTLCSMGADPVGIRLRYASGRKRFVESTRLSAYWVGDCV